jgi:drug/metabolite transporter (DMT)-like permease
MILVGFLAAIYAVCYATIKTGLVFAPPLRFAGFRALIASVALFAVIAILRRPLLPPRRVWSTILPLAVTGTVFGLGAMFLSPGRTGAGLASVLGNTAPLIAIPLAAVVLGERVTRHKVVALFLGFVGVSLIAYPAITDPAASGALGAVLPLTAATGFATASLLIKRIDLTEGLLPVTAWQLAIGAVPLFGLSAWLERGTSVAWNSTFVSLLLFLGLVGTALTTVLWYWLLQREELGRLSLFLFLVPVMGLAIAALAFHERIGRLEAVGVVITLAGIAAVVREMRQNALARREARPAPVALPPPAPACSGAASDPSLP